MSDGTTPRPWLIDVFTRSIVSKDVPSDGGDIVCCEPDAHASAERWYENASLIVTAVNSHDALVKALTDCLKFCEIQRRRREHKGLEGPFLTKAIDNARAALRLAGEDKP